MRLRRLSSALAACAGPAVLSSAGTARAYAGEPEAYDLPRRTDHRPRTHDDTVNGTYFPEDAGGVGLRGLVHHGGKPVGKAEFHPPHDAAGSDHFGSSKDGVA
ncbi:hypothetical protein ACFQ8C_24650 [Streptomyces sp. NPDC056503]|uniref:hypothetical protein n=1 Tax=Streptomyces sp. NPDC056503 TaxID=3345842 RepID=UPI003674424B